MTVIVVSNRVARAKSDEPVAGGLAAALIPMVKDSGAIWVGSSGETTDRRQTARFFAQIEALGTGALATVDMPAKHYRGYYEGFANSALWPALHSRPDLIRVTATIMRHIAKSTPSWRVRCCVSAGRTRCSGYRTIISSPLGAEMRRLQIGAPDRLFPAHALGRPPRRWPAVPQSCRSRHGDARLRSHRLPDRRGSSEFRGLSPARARRSRR